MRWCKLSGVLLVLAVSGALAATRFSRDVKDHQQQQPSCQPLRLYLENKNMTELAATVREVATTHEDSSSSHNTICGGRCCDKELEDKMRQQAKDDFLRMIHHHSRSLLGLLATTADALRDTVTMLARQSENKTLTLFSQVYRAMAAQSKSSIANLYQTMIDYVSASNTAETLEQPLNQEMLHERFAEFFKKLFPIAYHQVLNPAPGQQDFTENFKTCLYKNIDEIEPFGDIPKQIGHSLSKSLEATRVLIQALTLGKSVLERTEEIIFTGSGSQQEGCYKALLRMTHCPKCKGIPRDVMPCGGFCTNVVRGCLTEPTEDLDKFWSKYIESVERLVVNVDSSLEDHDPLALNVEHAVRNLDSRISDAVMHAMEKGPTLEEKVRRVCGRPELESSQGGGSQQSLPASLAASTRQSGAGGPHLGLDGRPILSVPPSLTQLSASSQTPTRWSQLHAQFMANGNFMASVVSARTFWSTLADTICEDYPRTGENCWNGERIGEYSKTVVASSLQKYNPEFSFSTKSYYVSANTSVLIDRMRQMKQIVQAQLSSAPDTSALLADETFEGSGSGDRPIWVRRPGEPDDTDNDDEDAGDDREDAEASGSGMGPIEIDNRSPPDNTEVESKDAAGQLAVSSSLLGLAMLVLFLVDRHEIGAV